MLHRKLAVLSGFSTVAASAVKPALEKSQIRVVIARKTENIDSNYFDGIISNIFYTLQQMNVERSSVYILLFSALTDVRERNLEAKFFFPALCREQVDVVLRYDARRYKDLFRFVTNSFQRPISDNNQHNNLGKTLKLLPIRNIECDPLERSLYEIYSRRRDTNAPNINKYISRVRGTKKLNIGSLTFSPTTNGAAHPIRRKSQDLSCDLNAIFRLGTSVEPRFEFDVTSNRNWSRHQFRQCDGTVEAIPSGTTHVNMRINGDFECG